MSYLQPGRESIGPKWSKRMDGRICCQHRAHDLLDSWRAVYVVKCSNGGC